MLLEKQQRSDASSSTQYEIKRINNNLVRLLGLYKIGSDNYVPQFGHHQVADLLEEVVADYREMLQHLGKEITLEYEEGLQGLYDKQLMYSVLENALNNACRYSNSHIQIRAETEGSWLNLVVEDDGGGFPSNLLEFNEMMVKHQPFDASAGTTGLGFYFASVVAGLHQSDDHKGYISLQNVGNAEGGRFTIHLPYTGGDEMVFDFL
jgi:K+-sensing histidine kinase KdpD